MLAAISEGGDQKCADRYRRAAVAAQRAAGRDQSD
jgi:hypothetical protein